MFVYIYIYVCMYIHEHEAMQNPISENNIGAPLAAHKLCRDETFMNTVELQYLSGIEGEVDSFGSLISLMPHLASLYSKH